MKVVCLAWGSLVWKPSVLPISGSWNLGGPTLPIEFARVGDGGELATVLCEGHPLSPVRWARLDCKDVATARRLLARREEIRDIRPDGVGTVTIASTPGPLLGSQVIVHWARLQGDIDAVIWTALPPRFDGVEGLVPTPAQAAIYLRQLTGEVRGHAEDYVRRVPEEIQTDNRKALSSA